MRNRSIEPRRYSGWLPEVAPRAVLVARLLVVFTLGTAVLAGAQGIDLGKLAAVKAGFILNFIRYTTWPATSFAEPDTPYSVVVLGSDAVADQLEAIARRSGPVADGRGLRVTRLELPERSTAGRRAALLDELRRAHVLYVGDRDLERAVALLSELADHAVLTVGDGSTFAASGGMIGLWRDGERVVFDANPKAIRATPLAVSARVLKLAHIVSGGSE